MNIDIPYLEQRNQELYKILKETEDRNENLKKEINKPRDIAEFSKYALPLIRKSFSNICINDLISVQPMVAPLYPSKNITPKLLSNQSQILIEELLKNEQNWLNNGYNPTIGKI